MKYGLAISALLISLCLPAMAEPEGQYGAYGQPQGWHGVLSPSDQSQFDSYYQKWVDATRKNDQDDISSNAHHMQEIMTRYNIPLNVSFDQVASAGVAGAYPGGAYPAGAYPNGAYQGAAFAGRLSADDQKNFDKYYSKWVDARRKNDQDDISNNARKMQEIMARNNIPSNVPFAQVASGGYVANPNAPYPNGAYSYPANQTRLSADDQRDFDKHYKKWVQARHKNDRDDVDENARKMQNIMARYNIPANVPFDQIASPGAAAK